MRDGLALGNMDGLELGLRDGLALGSLDGLVEGLRDGLLGLRVGTKIGAVDVLATVPFKVVFKVAL